MEKLPKFILEKPEYVYEKTNEGIKRFLFEENEENVLFFYNLGFSSKKRYLFWDEFRYKEPLYDDVNLTWRIIKIARKIKAKKTPIKTEDGKFFTYNNLPDLDKFLHESDLYLGGNFWFGEHLDEKIRKSIFLESLSEEAIASAQLEGAHSTREVAKKLIEENKKPKSKSEIMILNNYKAMMKLEADFLGKKDKKISLETLLDFHKILTKDAIENDNFDASGRLRNKDEIIDVVDNEKNYILHESPDINFVKKELVRLIDFINDEENFDFFHPIIKAIIIHFWIGYLHPFYDGNGRIARLLFYLYLLKHNYYFFGYFPISLVIKKSQQQYKMSYVYSEQDDEDMTYFIDYNIRKIKQAENDFKKYVDNLTKKIENLKERNKKLELELGLNERQLNILEYLNKSVGNFTTLSIYLNNNKISKSTGIKDLKFLKKLKLVDDRKIGREIKYFISEKGKVALIK